MNLEFPGAVPEIPVTDLNKAAAYYKTSLGFTVDWGDEDGGIVGISKGNCRIFLTNKVFRAHYGNGGLTMVWFNVNSKEEVNELYQVWSANKASIVSSPESKPWGLYEFMVADPDGNLFRIFYDFATPQREGNT